MFTNKKIIKILIIHGPNLNLLGERSPEHYGTGSFKSLEKHIRLTAQSLQIKIKSYQSNYEGKLIDIIHRYRRWTGGIIINPGALTHYSYALRDALEAVNKPVIEVHLSDIHQRDDFRKVSVIKSVCLDQITGEGFESYTEGLKKFKKIIKNER